jgi:hypothetical protein
MQAWALPYRARNGVVLGTRGLAEVQRDAQKQLRRFVVEPWKEGSKHVRSRTRYGLHRIRVNTRVIGARLLRGFR